MRQNTFKWVCLSLFFLMFLSACNKEKLAEMKRGKYEMINIRTFADGQKDTIHCMVYGPRVLKHHYYFSPEIEGKVLDEIDVHVSRRRMLVNGFPKRVESMSIRFYSGSFPSEYFGGTIDSYDLQESKLEMSYTSTTTNYTYLEEETTYTGTVQFNWVEL